MKYLISNALENSPGACSDIKRLARSNLMMFLMKTNDSVHDSVRIAKSRQSSYNKNNNNNTIVTYIAPVYRDFRGIWGSAVFRAPQHPQLRGWGWRRPARRGDGCCAADAVLLSSATPSDTRECASPGQSRRRCPGRVPRTPGKRSLSRLSVWRLEVSSGADWSCTIAVPSSPD